MALRSLSRFAASVLLGFALLSGCCANNICDRDDSKEDLIKLEFARSFTTADLSTILIQRYPLITNPNTKPEVITLTRQAAQAYDIIELNNTMPFSQVGSARLNNYKYLVLYYGTPRKSQPDTALVITRVSLKGGFEGNGCCTYYTNTEKLVTARYNSASADTTYNLRLRPILKIHKK